MRNLGEFVSVLHGFLHTPSDEKWLTLITCETPSATDRESARPSQLGGLPSSPPISLPLPKRERKEKGGSQATRWFIPFFAFFLPAPGSTSPPPPHPPAPALRGRSIRVPGIMSLCLVGGGAGSFEVGRARGGIWLSGELGLLTLRGRGKGERCERGDAGCATEVRRSSQGLGWRTGKGLK